MSKLENEKLIMIRKIVISKKLNWLKVIRLIYLYDVDIVLRLLYSRYY